MEGKKQKILAGDNPKNENVEEITKKIKHMKIMKLLTKGKRLQEEKNRIEKEKNEEGNNGDNNVVKENEYDGIKGKENDNDNKEKENDNDNKNKGKGKENEIHLSKFILFFIFLFLADVSNEMKKEDKKDVRQTVCYLYLFKKKI